MVKWEINKIVLIPKESEFYEFTSPGLYLPPYILLILLQLKVS